MISFPVFLSGQEMGDVETQEIRIDNLHEELVLVTDRSLYAVDELIYFKAYYRAYIKNKKVL